MYFHASFDIFIKSTHFLIKYSNSNAIDTIGESQLAAEITLTNSIDFLDLIYALVNNCSSLMTKLYILTQFRKFYAVNGGYTIQMQY